MKQPTTMPTGVGPRGETGDAGTTDVTSAFKFKGVFSAPGTTPCVVPIECPVFAIGDIPIFTIMSPNSPSLAPCVTQVTAGVGFTVTLGNGDSSLYGYTLITSQSLP